MQATCSQRDETTLDKITVEHCDGTGFQKYYKTAACPFCLKDFKKLVPHLERAHQKEQEVSQLISLDKNSQERKILCLKLSNLGNFKHNINVLKSREGSLKVVRRPTEKNVPAKDYVCCPSCLGFFFYKDLWRHVKSNCPFSKKLSEQSSLKLAKDILTSFTIPDEDQLLNDERVKKIVYNMRHQEIIEEIEGDWLLLKYVKIMADKYILSGNQENMIREKVRGLARLFSHLKEAYPEI
jgi:hypothetical protein